MADYVIYTDSTTDMDAAMQKNLGVEIIPLEFTIDDKSYFNYPDHRELAINDFYDMLRAGSMASTSLINTERYTSVFEPVLQAGTDILYIAFSSGLTGSVACAFTAAEELSAKYPERKMIVVDSLAASMGECMLVFLAVQKKNEGLGIEELAQYVRDTRDHITTFFVVDDLKHLHRGGRVSAASAILGSMLNIKPVLKVDLEGHLIPIGKVRGRAASLEELVKKYDELATHPETGPVFISHGDAEEDAKWVAAQIKKKHGVKDIYINTIGPVIGAHSGPRTVAFFFYGPTK